MVFLGYLRGTWRYLSGTPHRFFILIINFYYVINKLIILVHDPHKFSTCPSLKVSLNRYFSIFNN
jgi:hypothetical protein